MGDTALWDDSWHPDVFTILIRIETKAQQSLSCLRFQLRFGAWCGCRLNTGLIISWQMQMPDDPAFW